MSAAVGPKVQVRKGVFETNSSSSHSLTLVSDELADNTLSDEQMRAGVVRVTLQGFGWEWERLRSIEGKAAYIMASQLGGANGNSRWRWGGDLRDAVLAEGGSAAMIVEIIEARTGCRVEVVGGECYIDHESMGTAGGAGRTREELENFLFSNSYVTLGNDNGSPPDAITNDLGQIEPLYTGNESRSDGYGRYG